MVEKKAMVGVIEKDGKMSDATYVSIDGRGEEKERLDELSKRVPPVRNTRCYGFASSLADALTLSKDDFWRTLIKEFVVNPGNPFTKVITMPLNFFLKGWIIQGGREEQSTLSELLLKGSECLDFFFSYIIKPTVNKVTQARIFPEYKVYLVERGLDGWVGLLAPFLGRAPYTRRHYAIEVVPVVGGEEVEDEREWYQLKPFPGDKYACLDQRPFKKGKEVARNVVAADRFKSPGDRMKIGEYLPFLIKYLAPVLTPQFS